MTKIEQLFGEGVKIKHLDKDQLSQLHASYKKDYIGSMSDEERKKYFRQILQKFRSKNHEYYKKYQKEYRRERIANDPEFAKRVREHTAAYYQRKKAKKEAMNGN